jgi:hypothetical protein
MQGMDEAAAVAKDGGNPLIEEAMKKAAVAWLTVPGGARAYPVWCLWIGDALYLVSGSGEQPAPGLPESEIATVTARGDHGGRIVSWPAVVSRLWPGSDEWDTIAPQIAGKRLNSSGTAEQTVARWAVECVVSRLTPTGEASEAGRSMPDGSLAAPAPPSPAARTTKRPFRLHRVRRPVS